MRTRRTELAIALAFLVLSATCGGGPRQRPRRLVMYCSTQLEWCQRMAIEFERASGVRVAMTRKSAGETLAQVRAERRNPRADVWWGGTGDAHLQAADMGLLASYRPRRLEELHPWAQDPAGKGEHRTTGIYRGVLGFAYNTEWLGKRGLPPPRTWLDLTEPRYRGEIQVANPSSSGTAYTAIATLVQLMGEDRAFEVLVEIDRNVSQYTASGAAAARAAARGEAGIAIVFLHDALTEKLAGFPLQEVVPADGTGFEIGCVSILEGARHPEEARLFVEYALSAPAQELAFEARSLQSPSNRSARSPYAFSEVGLIELDLARFGTKAVRDRLLARWESQVRSASR